MSYEGLTPIQIREAANAAVRRAEDEILADIGLGMFTEQLEVARERRTKLQKSRRKIVTELSELRFEIRMVRLEQQKEIREAMSLGVSPARIVELTSIDRSSLSKLLKTPIETSEPDESSEVFE